MIDINKISEEKYMTSSDKMWAVFWVSLAMTMLGFAYLAFDYNNNKNIAIAKATTCEQAVLIGGGQSNEINLKLMTCKLGKAQQ